MVLPDCRGPVMVTMGNPRNNEWVVFSASRFSMEDMASDIMQIVNHLLKLHKPETIIQTPTIPVVEF